MTHTLADQPAIETERLVLRAPRRSDAGLVAHYAGDERVARMTTSIPHPLPPGAAEAFVAKSLEADPKERVWVMDAPGLSELIGLVSLDRVGEGRCEIGYWIAPAFWSTGYASEAVGGLLDANPLGCEVVFASVFQDNPASARVLTGAGFAYLGDAEAFSVARGARVPTWTYSRRMG